MTAAVDAGGSGVDAELGINDVRRLGVTVDGPHVGRPRPADAETAVDAVAT